ncbi:DNA polymerase IV [Arthrobacter sp. NPDC090010]|uniref:DNA polymerase IV n=1 Tax=Arthrobacter sp. NPDC090010 TaxID=3363942 RepID=UPI00380D36D8
MDSEERERWRRCSILHVDMDAFFVSVEQREQPALMGKPVIVGVPAERSVVLSASYEARAFGVRSAMPMSQAYARCPQAIVVRPRHELYYQVSGELMQIFRSYTDAVEQLSVDEAFLDVAGALRRVGTPVHIAEDIRRRVRAELGVPASVGIAGTKFLAKIASTRSKPDGLLVIEPEKQIEFLHSLPVNALWGVGGKFEQQLARLGITTVADVAATPLPVMRKAFGAMGEHVHELAWGRDPRKVTPVRTDKSMSAETTFAEDVSDPEVLHRALLSLSHRVGRRLRAGGVSAGGIALKLRYADFSTISRSRRLDFPTDSASKLYEVSKHLLESVGRLPQSVRLLGVRADHLQESTGSVQLTIDRQDENWRKVEKSLDEVWTKFGAAGLTPARLLHRAAPPEESRRDQEE